MQVSVLYSSVLHLLLIHNINKVVVDCGDFGIRQCSVLGRFLRSIYEYAVPNELPQDKTGTLTQNIMHVENLAIYDTTYEANAFHAVVTKGETPIENNISQVAAVGAICNSATFETSNLDEKISGRNILGNATGKPGILIIRICCINLDCRRRHSPLLRLHRVSGHHPSQMAQRFPPQLQLQGMAQLSSKNGMNSDILGNM